MIKVVHAKVGVVCLAVLSQKENLARSFALDMEHMFHIMYFVLTIEGFVGER